MKLSKKNLKILIESFLNEDNNLFDVPDDYGLDLSMLDKPDYDQLYEKYLKIFNEEREKIKKETLTDISGQISEKSKESLANTLDRINLVLVKKIGNDPTVLAACFSIIHAESGMYTPKTNDIKDEDILKGKNYFNAHKSNPFKFPVILVRPAELIKNMKNISEDEIRSLIAHEIDHAKYAVMQTRIKRLNQEQVRNILRNDLIGKDRQEIANIFLKEKYFNDPEIAYKKVFPMSEHYYNLFEKDIVEEKANIEEFAVRINILDRHPDKDAIIDAYNKNDIDYFEAAEFDEQIAQLLPFLAKDITQNELDKIVNYSSRVNIKKA